MTKLSSHDSLYRRLLKLERNLSTFQVNNNNAISGGGSGGNPHTTQAFNAVDDFGWKQNLDSDGIWDGGQDDSFDELETSIDALNEISSGNRSGGKSLYIPRGNYFFSNQTAKALVASNTYIYGDGPATRLNFMKNGAKAGTFFSFGAANGTDEISYAGISNMMLVCQSGFDVATDTSTFNGEQPLSGRNAIHLNDGGHLFVHDLIVSNVGGLITVGSRAQFVQGTITSVNTTANGTGYIVLDSRTETRGFATETLTTNDTIVFTSTFGNPVPAPLVSGKTYFIDSVGTAIGGGAPANAIRVASSLSGAPIHMTNTNAGASFQGGSYLARVQRYEVTNIIGTFNQATPSPNRIDIENGTSGAYTNIEIVAANLNYGNNIKMNATDAGADQHWFTNVHIQGGSGNWFEADLTEGPLNNWVFTNCVMDGSEHNSIYIHDDSAPGSTVLDTYFIGCHTTTRSGTGIRLSHSGTSRWNSLQFIGGRHKVMNNNGINMLGAHVDNIAECFFFGVSILHDRTEIGKTRITDADGDGNNVLYCGNTSIAEDAHYLSIGDEVHFNGNGTATSVGVSNPSNLVAGSGPGGTYYVRSFPDDHAPANLDPTFRPKKFTLTATNPGVNFAGWPGYPGTLPPIKVVHDWDSGGAGGTFVHCYAAVDVACILGGDGTRMIGCIIAGFSDPDTTFFNYCVSGNATPINYNIISNTGRGILTGWQKGSQLGGSYTATTMLNAFNNTQPQINALNNIRTETWGP